MPDPILMIHGAWQGSWSFDLLTPALESRGLSSRAIDLPGNGVDDTAPEAVDLDLYLDVLDSVIDEMGGRVTVLGHSGGGLVATALAERFPDKVGAVVYLVGMCLPNGENFGELQARAGGSIGISGDIIVAEGGATSTVPEDKAVEYFLNDCDPELARSLAAKLTPQPEGGRLITSPATDANFGALPKLYIEGTLDASMNVEQQRAMQALAPDMTVVSLEVGHVPQVIDPEGVADAIDEFVRGISEI